MKLLHTFNEIHTHYIIWIYLLPEEVKFKIPNREIPSLVKQKALLVLACGWLNAFTSPTDQLAIRGQTVSTAKNTNTKTNTNTNTIRGLTVENPTNTQIEIQKQKSQEL